MASSSHQAARELASEFTPTLVEVLGVQRPKERVPERRKPRRTSRHRARGMSRTGKALAVAAVVLLMVCAYAFGVLGRDTAVGLALQHAVNAPRPLPPPPAQQPELVIPLESIPIGEPWFSAPDTQPPAPPEPARKAPKRGKR